MGGVRVGIRVRSHYGMAVRRPFGSGDWVVVLFLDAVWLDAAHSIQANRGDCIVYAPDTPTYIAGVSAMGSDSPGTIFNSFAHIATDLAMESLVRYGWLRPDASIGVPFRITDTDWLEPLLLRTKREALENRTHWRDALRLNCAELFLLLAREADESGKSGSAQGHRHEAVLREVRLAVYASPGAHWSAAKMASSSGLKESRFSALYHAQFGTSPMNDVLKARIELAKQLLRDYDLPVMDVAQECGFTNPYHFSRYFKQIVGCAPSQYEKAKADSAK